MTYINNGEITLSRSLTDQERDHVMHIFDWFGSDVMSKGSDVIVFDEDYGYLESDLFELQQYLQSIGVTATGTIQYCGDADGCYVLHGNEIDVLDTDEAAVRQATDGDLITELSRRGYTITK